MKPYRVNVYTTPLHAAYKVQRVDKYIEILCCALTGVTLRRWACKESVRSLRG